MIVYLPVSFHFKYSFRNKFDRPEWLKSPSANIKNKEKVYKMSMTDDTSADGYDELTE